METDLGDLCGISELWGKESMPRGNPQIPLGGRHPACRLCLLWYPEPAMHVSPKLGYKQEAEGGRREFAVYFLGYRRYLKYFFLVNLWNVESMNLSSMTIIFTIGGIFKRIFLSVKF